MKKIFIFAAAAAMFASCAQDELLTEVEPSSKVEQAIGFGTWTNLATRAENSSATNKYALENYQYQFTVYGYKYVGATPTETSVFNGQLVQWSVGQAEPFLSAGDWFYAPVRYWDKAAKHYSFYACTPSTAPVEGDPTFTFDTTNKKFSLSDYTIDGKSLAQSATVTGQPNDIFAPNNDITKNRDYMIATDVPTYNNYTKDRVQLDFNHILSRINLAVKTTIPSTAATVTLKELSINKLPGKGSFDEGATITETLADGTAGRWTVDGGVIVKFGYLGDNAIYLTAGDATATIDGDYNYVYQGLVIPQKLTTGTVALDGEGIGDVTTPYLMIKYEIAYVSGEKEENVAYYDLASLFQNGYILDAAGRAGYQTEGTGEFLYSSDQENFYTEAGAGPVNVVFKKDEAYYKSATDFDEGNKENDNSKIENSFKVLVDANGNLIRATRGNADVTFCEGWQNNLLITIDPTAILFDAEVYEWVTKENVEVTVE